MVVDPAQHTPSRKGQYYKHGPVEERFWSYVDPCRTDNEWLWLGSPGSGGYGNIWFNGKQIRVHHWAYINFIGPIPAGLEIDHICHNQDPNCMGGINDPHRLCVNPEHLEVVTHLENVRRGKAAIVTRRLGEARATCPNGHPWTRRDKKSGQRQCKECRRIYQNNLRKSKREGIK